MIGTIIKGKDMDENSKLVVSKTLGHYSAEDSYFISQTPLGLLIFDVEE